MSSDKDRFKLKLNADRRWHFHEKVCCVRLLGQLYKFLFLFSYFQSKHERRHMPNFVAHLFGAKVFADCSNFDVVPRASRSRLIYLIWGVPRRCH